MEKLISRKIGRKFQITIPLEIRREIGLKEGDYVDFEVKRKRVSLRFRKARLSPREMEILKTAEEKIKRINEDMINSKGLTLEEANAAARAGIIDYDQRYWWMEEWQKGEREAEKDIRAGRVRSFEDAESLISHLHKARKNET